MTLKCPVCRGHLSTSNTIDEEWLEDQDAWIYRYACGGCLSVVSQRIPEISQERPRVEAQPPKIDVGAGVVARLLETLRAAAADESLHRVVASVLSDPERRLLLRIPEVFAVARPGWGDRVMLADRACYRHEQSETLTIVPERVTLRRYSPSATRSDPVAVLARGEVFLIRGIDANRFLLAWQPDPFVAGVAAALEYVADPDLVAPDPNAPRR